MKIDEAWDKRVIEKLKTCSIKETAKYFHVCTAKISDVSHRYKLELYKERSIKGERLTSHYCFTHHRTTDKFILDAF